MAKSSRTAPPVTARASRTRPSARKLPMSIEYLLVTYPGECAVRADGNGVGFTNHVLMLPADEYTITIDAPAPTVPTSQDVVLAGTSIMRPKVVSFA